MTDEENYNKGVLKHVVEDGLIPNHSMLMPIASEDGYVLLYDSDPYLRHTPIYNKLHLIQVGYDLQTYLRTTCVRAHDKKIKERLIRKVLCELLQKDKFYSLDCFKQYAEFVRKREEEKAVKKITTLELSSKKEETKDENEG